MLRAALRLVDARGLEALSMRKLAQELGVEAMSLYNHVEGKDDIVAGIVDLVTAEIDPPGEGPDWKDVLRARAASTHEALTRHPWAARIWMTTSGGSDDGLRHADAVLRRLREAGFSPELTYHAFHVLQGYTIGYTLQELSFPYDREQLRQLAARFLGELPADEFPDLAAHIVQHTDPPGEAGAAFALGLDLILDGLERLRDGG